MQSISRNKQKVPDYAINFLENTKGPDYTIYFLENTKGYRLCNLFPRKNKRFKTMQSIS